jgi:predicted NBD/HSP70 family sugar kinase
MSHFSSTDKNQASTRDIRKANRLQVLHYLLVRKTSTRQELSNLTGLSMATVANLITSLQEENLVIDVGTNFPPTGRPIGILAINAQAGYSIGVDIAETYIHFELFDLILTKISSHQIDLPQAKKHPDEIVQQLTSGIRLLISQSGIEPAKVIGIGISVPGPFDHDNGVSIFGFSWGWVNVPLKKMLEKELPYPLYLDNPLKFNTIAEAWFGAGKDADSMAALVIGTGVGAGLVINGQLFHGASNTAGEWGHSIIMYNGRECRCGNRGCVEAYVGALGILETLAELDPDSPLLFPNDQNRSIQAIAEAAYQNDPIALAVIQKTAQYLSAGIASLINTLNPHVVILGSWVMAALGELMLPELKQYVQQQSLAHPFKAVQISLSELMHNPVSLGGATLVLEEFFYSANQCNPVSLKTK